MTCVDDPIIRRAVLLMPELLHGLHCLPAAMQAGVQDLMKRHPEYADPEGARGNCFFASYNLQLRVQQEYPTTELVYWQWHGWQNRFDGPVVPHHYYDKGIVDRWPHTGFSFIDGSPGRAFYIDLTARQFDPDAPWPLIWMWHPALRNPDDPE